MLQLHRIGLAIIAVAVGILAACGGGGGGGAGSSSAGSSGGGSTSSSSSSSSSSGSSSSSSGGVISGSTCPAITLSGTDAQTLTGASTPLQTAQYGIRNFSAPVLVGGKHDPSNYLAAPLQPSWQYAT